ncbi:dienelactone hydrolase family protein [Ginsengibacter hankyongi]|nr:dienelactone hydrolase family protein [Ginsengibacter hankyongi]
MNIKLLSMSLIIAGTVAMSCNQQTSNTQATSSKDSSDIKPVAIKEEPVTYNVSGKEYNGYITYDSNQVGKRPGVLVVHEWWGLTDYPRMRAKELAALGYVAMAVDMYGGGKIAPDPKTAMALATPYYKEPTLAKTVLDAAINKLKTFPETDTSKLAAIGYCYGGYIVLNAVKLGADLKGVVSFHGDLSGVAPNKNLIKAKILICHGDSDQFVNPEVAGFKKSMDSAGVDYTFKSYANATHAFTNPASDENGKKFNMPIKYNAAADTASWNDMKEFFKKIF